MSEDQFTKLFKYMTERFDELETKVDTKADGSQVEHLQSTLDGVAHRLDIDDTERLAMSNRLERHERWIGQLADRAKLELSHD